MTKGYVCVECGSQIVGHSKADCDSGKAAMLFEIWWDSTGKYIDPDTDDVSWFDKRKELAGHAYQAGRKEVAVGHDTTLWQGNDDKPERFFPIDELEDIP